MGTTFGITRQMRGGDLTDRPAGKSWLVPFRPCKPPIPKWIVDWPLETSREDAAFMHPFAACFGPDGQPRFGDARAGVIEVPAGPLSSNPAAASGNNPSPNRLWFARVRGAGTTGGFPNRHIAVSPSYTGPARITMISFTATLQAGGGAQPRDTWTLGVGSAQNVVDVSAGDPTAGLNGYTVFDVTETTDQPNEQIPTSLGALPPGAANMPVEGGANWSGPIIVNIPILLPSFKLWLAMNTYGINASAVTLQVAIETLTQGGGQGGSFYGLAQTWQPNYLG